MRCDRCRHWTSGGQVDGLRQYENMGHCSRPLQLWSATEWVGRKDDGGQSFYRVRTEAAGETRMFVQDGSDYRAFLFTAPDFFCAHFVEMSGGETERAWA